MLHKLKRNTVYMDRVTGNLRVLIRCEGVFKKNRQWALKDGVSIMPEELNPNFSAIIHRYYELLGDL